MEIFEFVEKLYKKGILIAIFKTEKTQQVLEELQTIDHQRSKDRCNVNL